MTFKSNNPDYQEILHILQSFDSDFIYGRGSGHRKGRKKAGRPLAASFYGGLRITPLVKVLKTNRKIE
jgi:hypothetical protein